MPNPIMDFLASLTGNAGQPVPQPQQTAMVDPNALNQAMSANPAMGGMTAQSFAPGQVAPDAGAQAAAPAPAATGYQQPTGVMGFLSNPLVQGALATYLGAISAPRYMGWTRALGAGGLQGLGAFEQAQQQQLAQPLLASKLAESQAGLAESKTALELAQRQLRPLPKEAVDALGQWRQSIAAQGANADPAEIAYATSLESMARGNLITPEDLVKAQAAFDEQKRLMEMYKGQAGMYEAQLLPSILAQMHLGPAAGAPTAGAPVSPPSAPAAGTPATPAPATTGKGEGGKPFQTEMPGKGKVWEQAFIGPDGVPKIFYLEGGKWLPVP